MLEKFLLTLCFAAAALGQLEPSNPSGRIPLPNRRSDGPLLNSKDRTFLDNYDYIDTDDEVPFLEGSPRERINGQQKFQKRPNLVSSSDCRQKTRTVAHETYCDLYYTKTGCDDGQALLRSCPNGLMYTGNGRHGLIGVCDYPHNVHCPENKKRQHNPPISTEHCDWLYGIFGHESSCTRYWTCWNGTSTEQFCVGGLLYNEETHACDWPQNVEGCQKHPLCKDDANGNVPLGKSCNRYWACQGGYPRLQRCPAMLVFDKTRKRCVDPPTEDCEIPATTSRPKDENDEYIDDEDDDNVGNNGNGRRQQGNNGNRRRLSQQQQQQDRFQQQDNRFQGNTQDLPFQIPEGSVQRPNNN